MTASHTALACCYSGNIQAMDRMEKMLDKAERVAANEQAASQINLNENQMTLFGKQTAVPETVSKELTDPLSAAVSKPDTQRNYNAVS